MKRRFHPRRDKSGKLINKPGPARELTHSGKLAALEKLSPATLRQLLDRKWARVDRLLNDYPDKNVRELWDELQHIRALAPALAPANKSKRSSTAAPGEGRGTRRGRR